MYRKLSSFFRSLLPCREESLIAQREKIYLEEKIRERTKELNEKLQNISELNLKLEKEIQERKTAEENIKLMQTKLIQNSRLAGMSEVASGVLHNVGNVLNSVNLTAELMSEHMKNLRLDLLEKLYQLLKEHEGNLGTFFEKDERAKLILPFLEQFILSLNHEMKNLLHENEELKRKVDRITEIVHGQKHFAKASAVEEEFSLNTLIDEVLLLCECLRPFDREIVQREIPENFVLKTDRHKLMQIFVNLVRNALWALEGSSQPKLFIRAHSLEKKLSIEIEDTGRGIPAEDLVKIFHYGFSQRPDGQENGLHTSALFASELGGQLQALSGGERRGTRFLLTLPKNH